MLYPFASEANPNVEFNYYQVREGTKLHSSIKNHLQRCSEFVKYARELVTKYNADSAYVYEYSDEKKIIGLNFNDYTAPLSWKIIRNIGCFCPKEATEEFNDVRAILPYFWDTYPKPFPEVLESVRYATLGNTVIIALTPNKDGTACRLSEAYRLDGSSINSLKIGATKKQLKSLEALSQPDWTPAPLSDTSVFTPTKEVEQLINKRADADDIELLLKYSRTSRIVKALFAYFFQSPSL
jgi:hypothetical protein